MSNFTLTQVLDELERATQRAEFARTDLADTLDRLVGAAIGDAIRVRDPKADVLNLACYAASTSVRAAQQQLDEANAELAQWTLLREEQTPLRAPSIDDEFARVSVLVGRPVWFCGRRAILTHAEKVPRVGVKVQIADSGAIAKGEPPLDNGWSVDVSEIQTEDEPT